MDRTGWTYEEQRGGVKLDCYEDIQLAQAVLRDDLRTEGNVKAAAISDGSQASADAASRRELVIYDTLTGSEALAATEGVSFRGQHANRLDPDNRHRMLPGAGVGKPRHTCLPTARPSTPVIQTAIQCPAW